MRIWLKRIELNEAEKLWRMQIRAFEDLYEKYQDTQTSPAKEKIDKIIMRLKQWYTFYYFIMMDDNIVGAIRVVDKKGEDKMKRISPIFVMPEYRNMGIAQESIKAVEKRHGDNNWELETILQEKGNCHLYEKMGYERFDFPTKVNERLTLVRYRKL
ncbi:hypothetical protein SAMN02910289_00353 [Lachnospiraceae bacterium RM5]|nr:hypothetical protein SAMN02910289_00353 [Lachnospiraceae bacterium RM5]